MSSDDMSNVFGSAWYVPSGTSYLSQNSDNSGCPPQTSEFGLLVQCSDNVVGHGPGTLLRFKPIKSSQGGGRDATFPKRETVAKRDCCEEWDIIWQSDIVELQFII